MSVSKELPEGWRERNGVYWRWTKDGSFQVSRPSRPVGWFAWNNRGIPFRPPVGDVWATAVAAMEALDREHPMEKQHGEK